MDKVNILKKLNTFHELWSPKIVGEVNDSYIKLAKLEGEFLWHTHKNEDEMFLVVKGKLTIRLRNKDVMLDEGEFFIIPKGTEHMPIAQQEVHVLLIEPKTTLNTGNVKNERTLEALERI